MNAPRAPWQDATRAAKLQHLERDLTADVLVIGAGIAGLTCALELAERGRDVIVIEREAVASGETGSTTAHLTAVLDTRYFALADMHGAEAARAAATSHLRGIAHLERVANAYQIECGFRRVPGFLCAVGEAQTKVLEREAQALAQAGLSSQLVRNAPLYPSADAALHVPHQAQFDPGALLAGVVRALSGKGVPIYAPVSAHGFDAQSATDQVGVRTSDGHSIRANHVIVATHTPINDVAVLHTKQASYRSYALGFAIPEAIDALCWDLDDPYHYLRTALDSSTQQPLLIVGGEDHRVGQDLNNAQHWRRLEDWARERFPSAGGVVRQWSGEVFDTSDGLAFIGRNPGQERVFVISGMSGNGMTYAGLGAELIADLVQGIPNPFEKLYEPARKPLSLGAIGRFVKENLNTAEQYTDWLGPADVARTSDIAPGTGAVLRRGVTRVAVYVDPQGAAHELSASCPHLGGVVAWNDAEKSWDCPCHGSRFDCYGKVLAGPAVSDLQSLAKTPEKVEKAS